MPSIYRERFARTLAHQPVDRCPIDLGGCPQATIEDGGMIVRLAAHLGFAGPAPTDFDKFDRRILEAFDVDFRRVGGFVGFDTPQRRAISDIEHSNEYGMQYRFGGLHWEQVHYPLGGAGLDEVAAYQFPTLDQADPAAFADWEARARRQYEESPYVIIGEHPVWGVLEMACWLCGYDHIMEMLALEPEFIHLLFGRILDFQKQIIRAYYERLGPYLHITTSGDDFGTQRGPFMSPAMFREFVKPYMRERIAYTRQFTDAVYLHHSCGSIYDIIPDLAEIGVGILNPIQPVAGMDPARLKATCGDRITFHGGLDTQVVLPSDDPSTIDTAVTRLIAVMAPQTTGGYIFAAAHNLQGDVTPGAIARMYRTALACQQR